MKKILVLSDLHCGHHAGLTHPGYLPEDPEAHIAPLKASALQYWKFYEDGIRAHDAFDVVFVNGDLIDGRGEKSGGVELWTSDRGDQVDWAIRALRRVPVHKKTRWVITRGTPYHTGNFENWEDQVADAFGAKIGEHEWVDIEGVVFDLKHHPSGSSSIPHGRHAAIARDRLWNILWNEREMQPRADVFIRSHVHYHNFSGGPDWLALTTPALQGFGSRFGARRCSGIVDFGFLTFTVNRGTYTWQPHIAKLAAQKAAIIKL